jgi:hypothetical protein
MFVGVLPGGVVVESVLCDTCDGESERTLTAITLMNR